MGKIHSLKSNKDMVKALEKKAKTVTQKKATGQKKTAASEDASVVHDTKVEQVAQIRVVGTHSEGIRHALFKALTGDPLGGIPTEQEVFGYRCMALASDSINRVVSRPPLPPHPHGVLVECKPTNLMHFYRMLTEAIGIPPSAILAITSTNMHSAAVRKRGAGGHLQACVIMRDKGIMGHLKVALPMSKAWMTQLSSGSVSSFVCDTYIQGQIIRSLFPLPDTPVPTAEQIYAEYKIPFSDTSDAFRAGGIAEHHHVSDTEIVPVAEETDKARDRRERRAAAAQARQEGVTTTAPLRVVMVPPVHFQQLMGSVNQVASAYPGVISSPQVMSVIGPLMETGSLESSLEVARLMLLRIMSYHPREVQHLLQAMNDICTETIEAVNVAANVVADDMEDGEIDERGNR